MRLFLLATALLLPWALARGSGGSAARGEEPSPASELREARLQWPKLDRDGRIMLLMRLSARPDRERLEQCVRWLREKDPLVPGELVRLLATCGAADPALRPRAEKEIASYVEAWLAARARKEKDEFDGVCALHGRKIPPPSEIEAGINWRDPWDEERRPLPAEAKRERAHAREVIGAIESLGPEALRPSLERIFEEHHDPEVLLRVVESWQKRKEWGALPAMADLARIQQFGRAIGGGVLIGEEKFDTMRLKWDLHKERLWWSRPEYVPRASRPLCAAASEITGGLIRSAREFDQWLLAHEEELRAHGVRLAPDFRARATATQPAPR